MFMVMFDFKHTDTRLDLIDISIQLQEKGLFAIWKK